MGVQGYNNQILLRKKTSSTEGYTAFNGKSSGEKTWLKRGLSPVHERTAQSR